VACDRPGTPGVATEVDCIAEGGLVTVLLTNEAEAGTAEPVVFVVADPRGGASETVTVPAGETLPVTFGGFADGDYSFAVTADGVALEPILVTVDCERPSVVTHGQDCAEGGYQVVVTNEGGTPATVTVTKDGSVVETVEVSAESDVTVLVPFAEEETATVEVLHDGEVLLSVEVTYDCENPTLVDGRFDCAEGGFTVELENDGDADATVIALIDDLQVGEVVVPAGGSADLFVELPEDEAVHLVVVHDGDVILDEELVLDCVPPEEPPTGEPPPPTEPPAQVLGVSYEQPLPATGSDPGRLALLGVGLLALGALMVSLVRSRRTSWQ
jgi:hypothetical protein